MRDGIPEHAGACFCEECIEHALAAADERWKEHQHKCKIDYPDRRMVPYHTDPEHPQACPDRKHCSACNLVIFEKVIR